MPLSKTAKPQLFKDVCPTVLVMEFKAPAVRPRRPYIDDEPDGYMESDKCFVANNFDLAVAVLDELVNGSR